MASTVEAPLADEARGSSVEGANYDPWVVDCAFCVSVRDRERARETRDRCGRLLPAPCRRHEGCHTFSAERSSG